MRFDFAVAGSGWQKEFFYTNTDAYEQFRMPGGGLLTARLLEQVGFAVAPSEIGSPVRCEHLGLKRCTDGAYRVSSHAGWTRGNRQIAVQDADVLILWDGEVGEESLPLHASILWACAESMPEKRLFAQVKERCFLMITADLARREGARISRGSSWERAATDLVWQIKNNPKFSYLRGTPDILVVFAEDAAVHIRWNAGEWEADLTLTTGEREGRCREKFGRGVPDAWTAAVAAAAAAWKRWIDGSSREGGGIAVSYVLRCMAEMLAAGYIPELIENEDYHKWLTPLRETPLRSYRVPVSEDPNLSDPDYWSIGSGLWDGMVYDLARRCVLEGSKALEGIPHFSRGDLTAVDRSEIESLEDVSDLIARYAADRPPHPLPLAVFGPPESDKVFALTQIAGDLLPDVEVIEYDVSRFVSDDDLAAAFRRIRDSVLSGRVPLAFFKEFDCNRDGRTLGWLRHFLAPIREGRFRDASGEHPVGKSLMVFASGNASSFSEFGERMSSEESDSGPLCENEGWDFIGGLRGTVEVLGPNRASPADSSFLLRRALILRRLLEKRSAAGTRRAAISEDVLHAMLQAPRYKHGARSMESILDMSRTEDGIWDSASIPSRARLSLHVDADAFVRLLLKDSVLNAHVEMLARAIHEEYCARRAGERFGEEAGERGIACDSEWENLPEEIKDSNREQAMSIPEKLLLVRCGFDAGDTHYPTLEEFSPEEVLLLARNEHIRWMESKIRNGWVYGPVRRDSEKIHPCLVEWDELSESERQKDVDAVLHIIPLLRKAGLRVYRMV